MRIAIPTTGKRKLSNKITDSFSRAPEFTIVTIEENRIKTVEIVVQILGIPLREEQDP